MNKLCLIVLAFVAMVSATGHGDHDDDDECSGRDYHVKKGLTYGQFFGKWKNNKPHGKGMVKKTIIEGAWKKGKLNKQIRFNFPDLSYYMGKWKDGVPKKGYFYNYKGEKMGPGIKPESAVEVFVKHYMMTCEAIRSGSYDGLLMGKGPGGKGPGGKGSGGKGKGGKGKGKGKGGKGKGKGGKGKGKGGKGKGKGGSSEEDIFPPEELPGGGELEGVPTGLGGFSDPPEELPGGGELEEVPSGPGEFSVPPEGFSVPPGGFSVPPDGLPPGI